jgi:peptidase E
MNKEEMQKAVAEADVVWLSGGDTAIQFSYFQKYGLDSIM